MILFKNISLDCFAFSLSNSTLSACWSFVLWYHYYHSREGRTLDSFASLILWSNFRDLLLLRFHLFLHKSRVKFFDFFFTRREFSGVFPMRKLQLLNWYIRKFKLAFEKHEKIPFQNYWHIEIMQNVIDQTTRSCQCFKTGVMLSN